MQSWKCLRLVLSLCGLNVLEYMDQCNERHIFNVPTCSSLCILLHVDHISRTIMTICFINNIQHAPLMQYCTYCCCTWWHWQWCLVVSLVCIVPILWCVECVNVHAYWNMLVVLHITLIVSFWGTFRYSHAHKTKAFVRWKRKLPCHIVWSYGILSLKPCVFWRFNNCIRSCYRPYASYCKVYFTFSHDY